MFGTLKFEGKTAFFRNRNKIHHFSVYFLIFHISNDMYHHHELLVINTEVYSEEKEKSVYIEDFMSTELEL